MRQGLDRLGCNVPMVDVETRVNFRFVTWEVQLVKKASLHVGYVEMEGPRPSVPGDKNANLRNGVTPTLISR